MIDLTKNRERWKCLTLLYIRVEALVLIQNTKRRQRRILSARA